MRVYYLEKPLSEEDAADVAAMLETGIEQVRIPHLFPAEGSGASLDAIMSRAEGAAAALLRGAGMLADYGARVGLVIPCNMISYGSLSEAIHNLTGYYPFVIQTAEHRRAIGNPGDLRIFDMEGMTND